MGHAIQGREGWAHPNWLREHQSPAFHSYPDAAVVNRLLRWLNREGGLDRRTSPSFFLLEKVNHHFRIVPCFYLFCDSTYGVFPFKYSSPPTGHLVNVTLTWHAMLSLAPESRIIKTRPTYSWQIKVIWKHFLICSWFRDYFRSILSSSSSQTP